MCDGAGENDLAQRGGTGPSLIHGSSSGYTGTGGTPGTDPSPLADREIKENSVSFAGVCVEILLLSRLLASSISMCVCGQPFLTHI